MKAISSLFSSVARRQGSGLFGSVSTRQFSHALSQHVERDYNNEDTPFEWKEENHSKIEWIFNKYPKNRRQSAIMPLLQLAQEQNDNWLPLSAMNKVAEMVDVSPIRVYEVASFFTMYNREKVGKFHLQVCGTTPCLVRGADKIIHTIENHLGIKCGETTKDGMFTLSEVECLGACVNAPMMQVSNEWFYENLDESNTVKLLDDMKAGKPLKAGPQCDGLNDCEGPEGQTTLKNVDELPAIETITRDFDALRIAMEEEERKKLEESEK